MISRSSSARIKLALVAAFAVGCAGGSITTTPTQAPQSELVQFTIIVPAATTSGMPPTRDATTAVEHAIASRLTMPSGS